MLLSEINLKFVREFLVLIFPIGRWLVGWWLAHLVGGQWYVGRWSVVGGRLVGGFKKARCISVGFRQTNKNIDKLKKTDR